MTIDARFITQVVLVIGSTATWFLADGHGPGTLKRRIWRSTSVAMTVASVVIFLAP